MINKILETSRLILREICPNDYSAISMILQDSEVMYAWEHAFSNTEVIEWIEENIKRYDRDGYGYWAVIEKESNDLIGLCGLMVERVDYEVYTGIGYIFKKDIWGKGYAFESALGCMDYAFKVLNLTEVTAQIRTENISSIKTAEKLGMRVKKEFIKKYKGKEMPHLLYSKAMK
ncbi:GNAT family N-acetyltransferase [Anaerofustis sp.]|uniref:GNAT family N-acetyltransferase n=1 Tax=Anaerofustis sp. TaxID=1872517 RepID=UPI0025B82A79|nr:GNAT family N-acetyltransferase [Anaerofustis sp.]